MHDQFPHPDNLVYLNHAAVGPWPKCTRDAVTQFANENTAQGAADYPKWTLLENTLRERLAWLINTDSTDSIALLKSTSEALSVIAYGLEWDTGDNIVLSSQEFPSNRIVWESLKHLGVEIRIVDFTESDNPENALIAATDHRTRLLTSSSIHYASGLCMRLEQLGEHCRAHNILFCVDAIQSLGAFAFDVSAVHADFVVADGHKWMLGPEGLALFYCHERLLDKLKLHQYGWHMVQHAGDYDRQDWQPAANAKRFECGSPNMLGAHALHASLGLLQSEGFPKISDNIIKNTSYLIENIKNISGSQLHSWSSPERPSGIINFSIENINNAALHRYLVENRVICALRGSGIRFSPHYYHSNTQLELAMEVLKKGVGKLR